MQLISLSEINLADNLGMGMYKFNVSVEGQIVEFDAVTEQYIYSY